jgi:hypothetical protein
MPFTTPSGRGVVIAGNPVIEELNVEVTTNVKPGRLVKKGTDADDVIAMAAVTDKPAGWVGWDAEGAHPSTSPATRDTAYAADKKAPIWYGPGTIGVAKLASGQNVTKDTPLVPASGSPYELAAASNIAAAEQAGTRHVGATSGSFPPGGLIVALAKENCDASSGAKDIIIESLI